ncbi:RNA-binding protein [bacterium]|nr:RNA-binding protein [bacterium]
MSKKLFIGSLDWGVTEQDLQDLFSSHGAVEEAIVIKDKFSGRSKGFGFVTFTNDEDADKALEELNESELKGRKIIVNEARPPRPRD